MLQFRKMMHVARLQLEDEIVYFKPESYNFNDNFNWDSSIWSQRVYVKLSQ